MSSELEKAVAELREARDAVSSAHARLTEAADKVTRLQLAEEEAAILEHVKPEMR